VIVRTPKDAMEASMLLFVLICLVAISYFSPRLLGLLVCVVGVAIFFPAWEQWADFIFSSFPTDFYARLPPDLLSRMPPDLQNLGAMAPSIFKQAGLGAVVFWLGVLMILVFRR
jgi:hypothetical protein